MTDDEIIDRLADTGRFLMLTSAVALPLARRRDFRRSFNALTAILAVSAVSKTFKAFWSEPRPDGEDHNSFPSQHSGECFAAAVSLAKEREPWIGPAAFGLAVAVAAARVLSGKHHPVDVVAGASIGLTAGNLTPLLG